MTTAVAVNRELIIPENEDHWHKLRARDITSTDVAALFGISPYLTQFELWHRKKSETVAKIAVNTRMKWGTRLQDVIAQGIAEDEGWHVRRMEEYMRVVDLRIGASFDFSIEAESTTSLFGLLEIKNVDSLAFKEGWLVDGNNVEAPPHIELQVQHQLAVSARPFAYIGALIGGNQVVLIRREPDEGVIEAIREKVGEFWRSIEANTPPAPNFAQDAEFIGKLYGYAQPGKIYDARGDERISVLMELYKRAQRAEATAKEAKEAAKAECLTLIGDAEKVIGEFGSIAAGIIGPTEIKAHTRAGYRSFKPYFKKIKEDGK